MSKSGKDTAWDRNLDEGHDRKGVVGGEQMTGNARKKKWPWDMGIGMAEVWCKEERQAEICRQGYLSVGRAEEGVRGEKRRRWFV